MNKIIKLSLILLVITAVSAAALAFTNNATKDIIEEKILEANKAHMQELFEKADNFAMVDNAKATGEKGVEGVFEALEGSTSLGYVIETKTGGFGGDVVILTAIGADGNIVGMRVATQTETAGLGSKIEEPDFTSRFDGKSAANELVLNTDIDQLGGATVSSKAALDGVNIAIKVFNDALK